MKIVRSAALLSLVICSGAAFATVPQYPFAAGPFASVSKAVDQAHLCGITAIRLLGPSDEGQGSAFFDQDVSRADEMCLMHWMTKHGRELKFEPRWWGDDFTKDWPVP